MSEPGSAVTRNRQASLSSLSTLASEPRPDSSTHRSILLFKDGAELRRWNIGDRHVAHPPPPPLPPPTPPRHARVFGGGRLGDALLAPHVRMARDSAFSAALDASHSAEEAQMAALTAGDTSALGFDSRSCDAAGSAMAMALRHGHTLSEANAAAHAAALAIFKGYSPMGAEVLLASSERS